MKEAVAAAALEPPQPQEDGSWSRRCRFAPDFPGFAGHFPGYAVLPAVVQILAAVVLAEAVTGRRLRLRQIDNAKFLIQLHPEGQITVRCREKAVAGRRVWEASLQVDAGTAAQFLLELEEEAC
jgi:3-hydroxyacyl-[acyl-carrier-protein] dehydratase